MEVTPLANSPLLNQWDLNCLRYSTVWEDYRCLEQAVPKKSGQTFLSIGSAGDNALSLLRHNPKRLVILDLSRAQSALVELKLAALRDLKLEEFITVLGWEGTPETRVRTFQKIAPTLSPAARAYWSENLPAIASGISEQGRLNIYFRKFRNAVINKVWLPEELAALISSPTLNDQAINWQRGNLRLLESSVKEFFSKSSLSREGRDPSQFTYVKEEDTGTIFLRRFMNLLGSQLIATNPYLYYFFTGKPLLGTGAIPLFREFENLKSNLDRVEIRNQDLESYLHATNEKFDFMNLSDLFEYLSAEQAQTLFRSVGTKLAPGGRLAYWTLLVDRRGLPIDEALSRQISKTDQTWFYSQFLVTAAAE